MKKILAMLLCAFLVLGTGCEFFDFTSVSTSSVSEPFGISPLEAMRSNVPTIISKQSGVAEVLDYAVKVNYWDVDAMADAIYGLISYPALAKMFSEKGMEEVTGLKWNSAAAKIKDVYQQAIDKCNK